jgi:protein-tyrosine phosphatase
VIDLHSHILPGLDDGPADLAGSLELARAAVAAGTGTIVATPHIREDYPFDPLEIGPRVTDLNAELARAGIELRVVPGAEVAISMVRDLDDETLASLCLGSGNYLLVESPYAHATDMLEQDLFNLQVRGFRVMLAHPERSPSFSTDPKRLGELVERGFACSITAASMGGRFGRTVRDFTATLFESGLVHDVASDAHDATSRDPDLRAGFRALSKAVPSLEEHAGWFTQEVPSAVLAGVDLPPPPYSPKRPRRRRLPRLRLRSGPAT